MPYSVAISHRKSTLRALIRLCVCGKNVGVIVKFSSAIFRTHGVHLGSGDTKLGSRKRNHNRAMGGGAVAPEGTFGREAL